MPLSSCFTFIRIHFVYTNVLICTFVFHYRQRRQISVIQLYLAEFTKSAAIFINTHQQLPRALLSLADPPHLKLNVISAETIIIFQSVTLLKNIDALESSSAQEQHWQQGYLIYRRLFTFTQRHTFVGRLASRFPFPVSFFVLLHPQFHSGFKYS